jgi:hypothetical protein
VNLTDQKLYSKKTDGTVILVGTGIGGAGSGDVVGPASATDNAIARYDSTTGKLIQSSAASVDDSGNLSATSNNATGTGANTMPVGTTAQRPTGAAGKYRYNTTLGIPEYWDAGKSIWVPFGQAGAIYEVEFLTVAGGGGGGSSFGGGGGAGGYISATASVGASSAYAITVGAGGAAVSNGSATSAFGTSTVGGGAGGNGNNASGQSGGSGGGGAGNNFLGIGAVQSNWGNGTTGQGNRGGGGSRTTATDSGGGGGGAGAVGNNNNGVVGGATGGAGLTWLNGTTYAGGGGAASSAGGAGGGGTGVGGGTAGAGTANTGGGGGGAQGGTGGAGGSGVVVVRYLGSQRATGGTVTASGGYTYHTFTSSGTFTA